jgi:quercetin dioxygenase-like cupin family protein
MIHRDSKTGQKLDVAGLNEITVLIDRSETELTEVAINSWVKGLDGPPHAHTQKEQNFLVTVGNGDVIIGGERHAARPGDFFFLPAGVVHQTINHGPGLLAYFLFNGFLDSNKEGHASFADHIGKVMETRRMQAETQKADSDPGIVGAARSSWPGKKVSTAGLSAASTVLIGRAESERCEAVHHNLAAGENLASAGEPTKEQTFYITTGSGQFTVDDETVTGSEGQIVFAPCDVAYSVKAGDGGLTMVSFGTIVKR